jgi:hypothetical protein
MPIEVIEYFHALPIDVTENGVVSQQKIVAKVLAVKTRKEDVSVLVGNVSKMVNQDKINIFNDPADLAGIVNPIQSSTRSHLEPITDTNTSSCQNINNTWTYIRFRFFSMRTLTGSSLMRALTIISRIMLT